MPPAKSVLTSALTQIELGLVVSKAKYVTRQPEKEPVTKRIVTTSSPALPGFLFSQTRLINKSEQAVPADFVPDIGWVRVK
jgi:hypothetical protein